MGKFLRNTEFTATSTDRPGRVAAALSPTRPNPFRSSPLPPPRLPNLAAPPIFVSPIQSIAFVLICAYLIAPLINDLTLRALGARAYLSLLAGAGLPVACIVAGNPFRSFRTSTAYWWLAYFTWLLAATPFSFWPGGSFGLLKSFALKDWIILIYLGAAVVTLRHCATLIRVLALGSIFVLFCCFKYGEAVDGRIRILDSAFFDNPNDLALQMLISACLATYLLRDRNKLLRIVGIAIIGGCLLYLLKTGSRSALIGLIAVLLTGFYVVQNRMMIAIASIPLLLGGILLVPRDTLKRLTKISMMPYQDSAEQMPDSDLMSQVSRTELLKKSIVYTIQHPIFGIGPGQFSDYIYARAKESGVHVASLGTHNSYTQVSSESGVPGLIFYMATLFTALAAMRRLMNRARRIRAQDVSALAETMLLALVAYAVTTVFTHIAYSRLLPTLAGMAVAVWLAGAAELSRRERAQAQANAAKASPALA